MQEHRRLLREIYPPLHGTEIHTSGGRWIWFGSSYLGRREPKLDLSWQRPEASRPSCFGLLFLSSSPCSAVGGGCNARIGTTKARQANRRKHCRLPQPLLIRTLS